MAFTVNGLVVVVIDNELYKKIHIWVYGEFQYTNLPWMLVKRQSPFSDGCNHSHVVNELRTAHKLPCKYPRFTRFMTSLAVRLETSSTSQRREERRVRERREGEKQRRRREEGGRKGTRKKIRQAANAFAVSKQNF